MPDPGGVAGLLAGLLLFMQATAAPAEPPGTVEISPGAVVERIACAGDPNQTYALYLSPGLPRQGRRPLLIAMDPRGRALIPLELFREAADRHGWVLASSWNTLSDGPREPNERAINAILPDVQRRVRVDTRRIYLAGFSGTARVAWDFAVRLQPHVAGIAGFGGGLPAGMEIPEAASFAFFGGAGETDFNYEEMRALDGRLDATAIPHRTRTWEGGHGWPPAAIAGRALDWLELRAIRKELRPPDDSLIDRLLSADRERARSLEAGGSLYQALHAWEGLAEDFRGLREVGEAGVRAEALRRNRAVRREIEKRGRLAELQRRYEGRFYPYLADFGRFDPPPLHRSLSRLQVESLKRRAGSKDDPLDARAAQRLLEIAFVHTSFYEPRKYLRAGDPARALAMLLIAREIKPESPQVDLNLARAYAGLGRREEALGALERLLRKFTPGREFLEEDPHLAPLRKEERFGRILERLD